MAMTTTDWTAPAAPQPLSGTDLRAAEAELGIRFPYEYRRYLRRQNATGKANPLVRGPHGWGWRGDTSTNYALLAEPFPHPDSYLAYDDELGDREPSRDDAEAWAAWDDECGVLQERKTAGAVYIQENGCGFNTLLVVTGPHRGEMWFDARATCDLILPMRRQGRAATFADWLEWDSMDLVQW